ncbi:MAG: CarD family transcriptional regulator [Clostridia bacterium]|nr:CarD family transcriptional regulator [Clostridia bacterium]
MNFKVNDSVLYGTEGVCKISEITTQDFMGTPTEYYVLKPIYSAGSTVFVPVANEMLTAKMRRIMSAEEIYALIRSMPDEELPWIENDIERRERCREIIQVGDRRELVGLIKGLYLHGEHQRERGRKLHAADERFLRDAEKILYEEFAHVLQIKRDEVLPFIMEQIDVKSRA